MWLVACEMSQNYLLKILEMLKNQKEGGAKSFIFDNFVLCLCVDVKKKS